MLVGLVVCVVYILHSLDLNVGSAMSSLNEKGYSNIFVTDPNNKLFILKQIIAGAFITVTMTGLDQEMMQKNISVKTLGDSQKNMITFSTIMVLVNLLFLVLGGLLYLFAAQNGMHSKGDDLFPAIALGTESSTPFFPPYVAVIFIIALISALFPSADGAITAITSSFCIDMLGLKRTSNKTEQQEKRTRMTVHLIFTIVFFLCVLIFKWINDKSIIDIILTVAGYTYGPLLGLFAFGILTKRVISKGAPVVIIALLTPVISYVLSDNAATWFSGYQIGVELILINGIFTFAGLYFISHKRNNITVAHR